MVDEVSIIYWCSKVLMKYYLLTRGGVNVVGINVLISRH